MGVIHKSAYREYLKSDHWRDLRISILTQTESMCCICLKRDSSNDAHHICYSDQWEDTKAHQLVCLCRSCHENVHKWLDIFPKPKNAAKSFKRWIWIRDYLRLELIIPFLLIKSCPEIRKLANLKPNNNVYRASIGLPPKWTPKANARVYVDKMPDRIRDLFYSRAVWVRRRDFFIAIIKAAKDPDVAGDAVREYLTTIHPMG